MMTPDSPASYSIGRRPVQLPDPLHARIAAIAAAMKKRTGRATTFAEVIERALDAAELEGDRLWDFT